GGRRQDQGQRQEGFDEAPPPESMPCQKQPAEGSGREDEERGHQCDLQAEQEGAGDVERHRVRVLVASGRLPPGSGSRAAGSSTTKPKRSNRSCASFPS